MSTGQAGTEGYNPEWAYLYGYSLEAWISACRHWSSVRREIIAGWEKEAREREEREAGEVARLIDACSCWCG